MPSQDNLNELDRVVVEFKEDEIIGRLRELSDAIGNEEWHNLEADPLVLMMPHDTADYIRALGKAIILLELAYGDNTKQD